MAAAEIDHRRFDELMSGGGFVLVNYCSPWCFYCRKISAVYDAIARQYEGRVRVVTVNTDENAALAHREEIEIVPTLVLYRGGRAIDSIVAPESREMIEALIKGALE